MKQSWALALWICWLSLAASTAQAQYNLEEFGIAAGPGFAMLSSTEARALGPTASANAFFSHYACGKGYGFHITAGATALFPATAAGQDLLDLTLPGRASLQFTGLDLGFMGKLRLHEYHRPREWAVFLGPKLFVPLLAQAHTPTGSASLSHHTSSLNHFWTGAQLSVQFRRALSKKQSWFIHPGVEYYFLPAFNTQAAGSVRPLHLFLHFGIALWDQRG